MAWVGSTTCSLHLHPAQWTRKNIVAATLLGSGLLWFLIGCCVARGDDEQVDIPSFLCRHSLMEAVL